MLFVEEPIAQTNSWHGASLGSNIIPLVLAGLDFTEQFHEEQATTSPIFYPFCDINIFSVFYGLPWWFFLVSPMGLGSIPTSPISWATIFAFLWNSLLISTLWFSSPTDSLTEIIVDSLTKEGENSLLLNTLLFLYNHAFESANLGRSSHFFFNECFFSQLCSM